MRRIRLVKKSASGWQRGFSVLAVLAASLLVHALPPAPAHAQRVEAYLSTDSVKVGERFSLSVVAEHRFTMEARFPALRPDTSAPAAPSGASHGTFGDLLVLAVRDSGRRYLGRAGMRRDSVVYEVTTFALDTARVAPVGVDFVQGADTARAASAERLLRVESVLPPGVRAGRDSAQLRPLAPPEPFPRPLWPWLLGGLGVLALAALLAYLWYGQEEEEDTEDAAPPSPVVPPAEAARRRLRRLEETTDLHDPDAAKPFYTDLSGTLRRYLMHRLGVRAFRSTTPELLAQLRRRADDGSLPGAVPARARHALEGADLAKFADQRPAAEARRSALADARAVIDAVEAALRPKEPSTAAEAPDDASRNATPPEEQP